LFVSVLYIISPATALIASLCVAVIRGRSSPFVVLLISIAATAETADVEPNMTPPTKLFVVLEPDW
jgi:hypothetical protein